MLNVCDQTRAFQVNCALATESRLRAMGIALLHLVRVQEHSISSANSSTSRCQEYLQAKERKERLTRLQECTRPMARRYLVQSIETILCELRRAVLQVDPLLLLRILLSLSQSPPRGTLRAPHGAEQRE